MKVYSRSQGKLIEVPDAQAGGVPQAQTTQTTSKSVTGFQPEQLGMAYSKALQAGDTTSASKLKSLYDIETSYQNSNTATSTEKKQQQQGTAVDNFINNLEKTYMESGGGEYTGVGARISGAKKSILAAIGLNDPAKNYKDAKEGFAATLKQLTGDTGVLTDQDFSRLSKLLPSLGSTPGEAKTKFDQLRSQMSSTFGTGDSQTTYKVPESKGGVLASIVPGIAELYKGKQEEYQQKGIKALPKQSLQTLIPGLNLLEKGGTKAAGEVLTILGLGSAAKSVGSAIKGKTVSGASAIRSKVASESTAKLSGDNIFNEARARINKVGGVDKEAALKYLNKIEKDLVGKTIDPKTILEKLTQFNKAYSTTGAAGKSAKALTNDSLSKATRAELAKVAPDVAAAQELLKKALGLQKTTKSINRQVLATGTGIGAAGLIGWLLGNKKK